MRHVADDAEKKKRLGRQISDGRGSVDDSPGDSIVGREIADSKNIISGSLSRKEEEEKTPRSRKSIDDEETKGERVNRLLRK